MALIISVESTNALLFYTMKINLMFEYRNSALPFCILNSGIVQWSISDISCQLSLKFSERKDS